MWKLLIITAKLAIALLSVASVGLFMFAGWLAWHYEYGIGLPDDKKLLVASAAGQICSSGGNHTFVPLAEIPPLIRSAILAYEEPDFYERPSLNLLMEPVRILLFNRSPLRSSISGSVTRCFMISTPIRGFDWHIANLIVMSRIERTFSRERIFELFLNELYFGRGAYGVAAAAAVYFGKPLRDLSIDQAAFIAALPRAPGYPSQNKDRAIERRNFVIDRMLLAGTISEPEAELAKEQSLVLQRQGLNDFSGG
jgi:membrane carboxypeptidase/penicillin-binding protein